MLVSPFHQRDVDRIFSACSIGTCFVARMRRLEVMHKDTPIWVALTLGTLLGAVTGGKRRCGRISPGKARLDACRLKSSIHPASACSLKNSHAARYLPYGVTALIRPSTFGETEPASRT